MESPRSQLYLNFQSPVTYPLVKQPRMYSTYPLNSPKSALEKMYSSKQALNMQAPAPVPETPKKGNIFQNMYNSLATIFVEQLAKVPTSLINHLTNTNNTLSVTIVPNEGIISHEFFKTLTGSKDQSSENMYIQCIQNKEPSMDFVDKFKLNNKVHIPKDELLGSTNDSKFSTLDDFDLCLDLDSMFLYEKALDNNQNNRTLLENKMELADCTKNMDLINNKNETISKDEIVSQDKTISTPTVENKSLIEEESPSPMSSSFSSMWNKVVSGVSNHFLSCSPTPKVCMKNQTTKNRRKANSVFSARGRGRGKSQLRRSGVSQSRHRKERSKHQLCSDIQDDLNTWEEFETYSEFNCIGEDEDMDCTVEIESHSYSLSLGLIDIKPKKTRQRKNSLGKSESFSMKVKYVPECSLEDREAICFIDKTALRSRLISEVSVDSEDSFIVFETGSTSDYDDFNYPDENEMSDSDINTESETDDESTNHRVRFNLKPTIHKMVKWEFAYRTARPGPWEEMARDRERFKDRIKSTGQILEPILSPYIRNKIWNERFAAEEPF